MLRSPDNHTPLMLLFSTPFAAGDYLRATGTAGNIGQLPAENLSEMAKFWLSLGVQWAALDRCPRCPVFVRVDLAPMAKWTREDFAKVWAHHRATRLVCGEIRVRSAISHASARSIAAARGDLEYVRDHFDCGIPYLHQLIGLYAGIEGDAAAKAASEERLKEFGSDFAEPLDFSPELISKAIFGVMVNFGILPQPPA